MKLYNPVHLLWLSFAFGCSPQNPPGPDASDAGEDAVADSVVSDVALDAGPDVVAVDSAPDVLREAAADVVLPCTSIRSQALGTGWNHVLSIGQDGILRAWGENGSGQLGVGDITDRPSATRSGSSQARWRTVVGGSRHSCGIQMDGSLWCWGVNVHGQLGVGDTMDRSVPTRVGTDNDWVEVACGGLHSCGLRAGGTLWCWGANPAGQLGTGAPIGDQVRPQRAGMLDGWRGLAAKARFVCALRPDDSLWCWGDNSDGQLGLGDTMDRREPTRVPGDNAFVQVRMGPLHTCALTRNHELYCWGLNDYGQFGNGTHTSTRTPVRIGSLTDWEELACGFSHTCGIRRGGTLWCWGDNLSGQLGGGDTAEQVNPRQVLSNAMVVGAVAALGHTCALTSEGTTHCWGDNTNGQIGMGTRGGTRTSPATVCER